MKVCGVPEKGPSFDVNVCSLQIERFDIAVSV